MGSNGITITKETFQGLDTEAKLNAVFDVLVSVHEECSCRKKACEVRLDKIEKRKKFDTGVSGGMGLIGGALSWIGQKILGG